MWRGWIPIVATGALAACVIPWLHPKLSDDLPPPSIDAEYEVYSRVLAGLGDSLILGDSTEVFAALVDAQKQFQMAWQDYRAKQSSARSLQLGGLAPGLRLRLASTAPRYTPGACLNDVPRVRLSRVGFNPDTTRAVVFYRLRVGGPPYPGCGYVSEGILYLARKPGRAWRVVDGGRLWIT